jgi:hypothetical protein
MFISRVHDRHCDADLSSADGKNLPRDYSISSRPFADCSFSDANGASNVLSFGTKFRECANRSQSFLIQRKEIR